MTATVIRETVTDLRPEPAGGQVRVTTKVVTTDDPDKKPWAFVSITLLPGTWWSCPDARTLRKLVDAATADTGLRRDGPRFDGQHTNAQWRFHYPLTSVTT